VSSTLHLLPAFLTHAFTLPENGPPTLVAARTEGRRSTLSCSIPLSTSCQDEFWFIVLIGVQNRTETAIHQGRPVMRHDSTVAVQAAAVFKMYALFRPRVFNRPRTDCTVVMGGALPHYVVQPTQRLCHASECVSVHRLLVCLPACCSMHGSQLRHLCCWFSHYVCYLWSWVHLGQWTVQPW
jgi:hypothetical protein